MLAAFPSLPLVLPAAAQGQVSVDRAKQADAAFKAGYAALANNDLQAARQDFQKVVGLVPQIEEGHSALGAVLLQLNVYPAAISELTHALRLKPDDFAAQTNLAMAYAYSDRNPEAIHIFSASERSAASRGQALPVDVLPAYARSLAATGQMELAVEKMQQATALAPQDPTLHEPSARSTPSGWNGREPATNLPPLFASIPSSPPLISTLAQCF